MSHVDFKTKFLVVDDFATMRRILKGLLKDNGFDSVDEAEDGNQAWQKMQTIHYDFIISDINMPNMNGFELLAKIKESAQFKHLPVLMVTAEARKEDIIRAAQGGASGYIVKPFSKSTLQEKVEAIMVKLQAKVAA